MKNTRNTFLMSVAAALIAGAGVAFAQAPSPAPAAQQSAPAEKTAPAPEQKGVAKTKAPDAGLKSGQADDKMGPKGDRTQRAQDSNKDDMKSKGMRSETKSPGKTSSDVKTDANPTADVKPDTKTKAGMKADAKTDAKPLDKSSQKSIDTKAATTGQGATGGSANLSTEQRTTIRTAIKKQNVQPTTNVTFSISVGTQVPRNIRFHSVPVEFVHIYPHWRGYDYFLVGDQIIVVNPRTHQIVAVLDA